MVRECRRPHRPKQRYRWRQVKPNELWEWREANGVTREEVAAIIAIHPSTLASWERGAWAPSQATQRRLRALIGARLSRVNLPAPNAGYHEAVPNQEGEPTVAVAAENQSPAQPQVATTEDTIRRRIETAWAQYQNKSFKLTETLPESRWGVHDGVVILLSKVTDAAYLTDTASGTFYRTVSPNSARIMSSSPREVIAQDRNWLYALFEKLPNGKAVLRRYHQNIPQEASVAQTTTPAQATPNPAAPTAEDRLLLFNVVDSKKLVMVQTTKMVELGPHQVHALLRKAGATVPDNAEIKPLIGTIIGPPMVANTTIPGFMVEWSLAKEETAGRFFNLEAAGLERIKVNAEQVCGMFSLVGKSLKSPEIAVTSQGYVKISWTEVKETVEEGG